MIKRILALLLALTVSALAAETNYFNAAPTVLTNTIITGSISLNGSVITDWPSGSGSQTPWTSNIDGGNFNLSGVNTVSVNNAIFIGDNSVMDLIGSRALTNGTYSLMSVGTATVSQVALSGWPTDWAWSSITNAPAFLTNGWAGAGITIDSANAQTNTYGGFLVIGGDRWQANGGQATGTGSWANNSAIAIGEGSWANNNATASGIGSWANYIGEASGNGSWANNSATAIGEGSWAMGPGAVASNIYSFAWAGSHSHGDGSFNIGAPSLLWLGDTNLQSFLDAKLDTNGISIVMTTNSAGISSVSGGQISIGTNSTPMTAANLAAAGAVTNGGFTINAQPVQNGGSISISGGGITAFYWPQSRGVIPASSGATRYGTDYQFTSFPTLTNSVLTFWNLPIVNTVSNLAVWSSAASGVATTTFCFVFGSYSGNTNEPSYSITNYVTAVSGTSKVTSNCTTVIPVGTWTMKMFPVDGSTNSLLSTVEGNIQ